MQEPVNLKNDIVADFIDNLKFIDNQVASFQFLQLKDWKLRSWQGFYNYLQESLGRGEWNKVPNKSGGFLGFWWCYFGNGEDEQYLQLEDYKLCFKISVKNVEERRSFNLKWQQLILNAGSESNLRIIKQVYRSGNTMTVAKLDGDYRHADAKGFIDLDKTLSVLREAERILEKAVELSSRKETV